MATELTPVGSEFESRKGPGLSPFRPDRFWGSTQPAL
jgi:hypothetical protein